jgi:hypothetical protein
MSQQAQTPATPRIFTIRLRRHTGMLILMRTRTYSIQGTLEQCEAAYKKAQAYNLVAGWWGVLSLLIMNWIAILGNVGAMNKLRTLAAATASPALR